MQAWDRYGWRKALTRAALLALGLLAAVSVMQGVLNGLTIVDFHWESAALLLRGENPYQWFIDGRYFQGVGVDATQAPSTIAFILPFGLLPFAAAWSLDRRKAWWLTGLLLAPALFKYTITVPMTCFFVMRRAWRPLALCAVIHIALTLALGWWTATKPFVRRTASTFALHHFFTSALKKNAVGCGSFAPTFGTAV